MTTATTPGSTMDAKTWGMLFILGLVWGGSFFFARVAVVHVPPFTLVFLRLSLAALALHIYLHRRFGLYDALRRRWRDFALLGLINNALPHTLIFFGQTEIGAGLASILNATTPVWTVLVANRLTTDEKLTPAKLYGSLLGLPGTMVLLGPAALSATSAPFWAVLLPVLAAVSYAFAGVFAKRFRDIAPPVTATGQLTASALMMLPVSLISDHPWQLPMPPTEAVLAIVAIALISTAFGYILFFRIMARAGATNTSLVTLLVPPSAIALGALVLGERLDWTEFAGMLLIGAGLAVLDGRVLKWFRRDA